MSASSALAPAAPQSYAPIAAALEADFRAQLDLILRYLPLAHSLRDSDRAGYYLRRLLALLDQRYELTPAERVQLLQAVLALLLDAQELHLQIRCLQVLVSLLHTHADLPSLSIPWRPLFDLLASLHFPSARTFTYPQSLLKQHSAQLVKLIHAARRYFPATTGREVWDAFSPYLSPFDNASTRSFSLIALFTPTHTAEQGAVFTSTLPTLLQYEGWYDHSPSALLPFFSLYARLSKHQVGTFSLLPHLPSLVSVYLQLLELDVGSQQSANQARVVHAYPWLNETQGGALEELSGYLAQVLVYHLHLAPQGKERSALSLLSQFLHTVNTYYHPSNQGKWQGGTRTQTPTHHCHQRQHSQWYGPCRCAVTHFRCPVSSVSAQERSSRSPPRHPGPAVRQAPRTGGHREGQVPVVVLPVPRQQRLRVPSSSLSPCRRCSPSRTPWCRPLRSGSSTWPTSTRRWCCPRCCRTCTPRWTT